MHKKILIINRRYPQLFHFSISTYLRFTRPLKYFVNNKFINHKVIVVNEYMSDLNKVLNWASHIIINRSVNENLFTMIKEMGCLKKVIYDIDDFIFDYPKNEHHSVSNNNLAIALKFIHESNIITVSNAAIEGYLIKNLNVNPKRIFLLPISLDVKKTCKDKKYSKRIIFITGNHFKLSGNPDYFIKALNNFLIDNDIMLDYIGDYDIRFAINKDRIRILGRLNLNIINKLIHENQYMFAIVPLDSKEEYNKYKSGIKYIHYSSEGIPGIFSDTEVHRSFIKNMENGILTKNNYDSWHDSLNFLYKNDRDRIAMGMKAYQDVKKNYSYEKTFKIYQKLLK